MMLPVSDALKFVMSDGRLARETPGILRSRVAIPGGSATDEQRTVVKRNSYAPFGETFAPTVIDGTGYTGHVMDQATGLTYMQQRYYDPQIARFLSVDPVLADPHSGDDFTRYSYAENNPYRFVDPDGRKANDTQSKPVLPDGVPEPPVGCGRTRDCWWDGTKWHWKPAGSQWAQFSEDMDRLAQAINPLMGVVDCKLSGCGTGGWVLAGFDALTAGEGRAARKVAMAGGGPASEQFAKRLHQLVKKLAGPDAKRILHDMKQGGERSKAELKEQTLQVLEDFGVPAEDIPSWIRE